MSESSLPPESQKNSSDYRPRTPWDVHVLCYALLGGLLVYVLVGRYVRPMVLRDSIGVESGGSRALVAGELADEVETKIDPNTASWAELDAFLPGVGEVIAKRIVAFREGALQAGDGANVADSGAPAVFTCPEDLQAVSGIGPKTVARIAPYLVFGDSPASRPAD